jgi:hypothetical protein
MAAQFRGWKAVRYIVVIAAIFLTGCGRPSSRAQQDSVEQLPGSTQPSIQPDAAATPAVSQHTPVVVPGILPANTPSSIMTGGEDQLRDAFAKYAAADEETRREIEERLSNLTDAGIHKDNIARMLGAMFAMENSIIVKISILNELYALRSASAVDAVTLAISSSEPLEVRAEGVSVLRDLGDERAIPRLQLLLTDPDANIRGAARDAITSLYNTAQHNQ